MNPQTFIEKFYEVYDKQFKGMRYAAVESSFSGGKKYLYIQFTILPKELISYGILENDPALHKMWIWLDADNQFFTESKLEKITGGRFYIKSSNPMYAMESIRVGWRDKKGTPEALIKHLTAYLDKLATVVKVNNKNAYGSYSELEMMK